MTIHRELITEIKQKEIIVSLIVTCVLTVILIVLFPLLPPQIPLFYSLSISEQQLTTKGTIFLLPFVMFVIVMLHNGCSFLMKADPTLKSIIRVYTLFMIFLLVIVAVHTLNLSL